MGVEVKYQLKDEIQCFLPLYEIPNETMNKLVYGYQLKTSQLKQDRHYKTSFIMIKICALRYKDIVSTIKTMKN